MVKFEFLDYVFFFCMAVLFVWIVLKMSGIINTPLWLQIGIPFATVLISMATFFLKAFKHFVRIEKTLTKINTKMAYFEQQLTKVDEKFGNVEKELYKLRVAGTK